MKFELGYRAAAQVGKIKIKNTSSLRRAASRLELRLTLVYRASLNISTERVSALPRDVIIIFTASRNAASTQQTLKKNYNDKVGKRGEKIKKIYYNAIVRKFSEPRSERVLSFTTKPSTHGERFSGAV